MGFKSKATKANKAKKVGRAEIKRPAQGAIWRGVSTHMKFEVKVGTKKTQGVARANYNEVGTKWVAGVQTNPNGFANGEVVKKE